MVEHYKLGLLGFMIVIAILVNVYSHRVYIPEPSVSIETSCLQTSLHKSC